MLCSTIKFQLVLQLIESGGANGNRASESRASEKMSGEQSAILFRILQISPKLGKLFLLILQLNESGGANGNQASESTASEKMSGEESKIIVYTCRSLPWILMRYKIGIL